MPLHPYIPFNNCMEVVMVGTLAGQQTVLTFGVLHESGITLPVLVDTCAIFEAWYHANLVNHLSSAQAFLSVKATDLTTETGPTHTLAISAPQAGANAAAPVPNNVAMVVSYYTNLRGRQYRGRNFVPGLPATGLVNSSNWNSTECDTIAADFAELQAVLNTDASDLVVLSRQHGGLPLVDGVFTPVTQIVAKQPVGTQRRRVIGRGA